MLFGRTLRARLDLVASGAPPHATIFESNPNVLAGPVDKRPQRV